jgi:DNA polymerase-4
MIWERAVVHLNVAHFAVAVERVLDRRLRQRPVIVAPQGVARAVVYDMSQEAYQAGVRKGMPLSRARRLCRDAPLLAPHPDRYERAMGALFQCVRSYAPLVERVDQSGHLFLDVTGTGRLFGPPPDVAWRIRKELKSDLSLEPVWSVAPNKLVAKVATRLVKPTGEYIVEPGEEAEFLGPLPLQLLPGIERDDLRLLRELELQRVGQVARLSMAQLQVALGSSARSLYEAVRGVDPSPVIPAGRGPRAVFRTHTLAEDTNDAAVVEGILYRLVEQVGLDLRQRRLAARRIGLTLDYADGVRMIRSATATVATANDLRLFALGRVALGRAWTRRVRLRHLRLTCDRLIYPPPPQLELLPDRQEQDRRDTRLVASLDRIRQRFGPGAIRVGRTLDAA